MVAAKVSEVSSRRPVVADFNKSIQEIAKMMADKRVSAVILVDGDKPVGILTERDLARQVCAKDLVASKTPATALMSAPVVAVSMSATIEEAAKQMIKKGVRHLAVQDQAGKLAGMITVTDLAWYLGRKTRSQILDLLYPYEEMGEEMP